MKGILLAAALATLGSSAYARDIPYPIKSGVSAVVTITGGTEQRATVRVGNGPEHELGTFDDDAIDLVEPVDINHDGYRDLVLGQSGGSTQSISRLFLYRPQDGSFQEVLHPAPETSPCRGFVNPVFDPKRAAFSVGCRYGAASNGAEDYVLRPDGSAHATTWATQALFGLDNAQAELTYHFREDGTIAKIDIEGEGSPLEGGTVPVSRLDLYDTPDVNARPSLTAAAGEHVDVVALRPRDWLQVRYASKTAGEVTKWVRYGDLRVDKHQYAPPAPRADGLELTLFNYLGDWDDESGGRFTLRLDNRGAAPVRLPYPSVWLLLINAQGDRIVHPLYQREPVSLGSPNARPAQRPYSDPNATSGEDRAAPAESTAAMQDTMTGLADDPIVWRKDEDGKFAYMVREREDSYVPLVPALSAGTYRAVVVVTDPDTLAEPLYSNEVTFKFPFPKRAP